MGFVAGFLSGIVVLCIVAWFIPDAWLQEEEE